MDFNVPDRVHIMPVGYEKQRVLMCASRFKADKVVLIGHVEDDEEDEERLQEIRSQLEEEAIKVERADCDLFDLYDSLGIIAELITSFEDDDVYVNVSTGSKITAIAGMIACMAIDATPYYAKAKSYSGKHPKDLEFVQKLPRYPIDAPDQQQIEMLHVIQELEANEIKPTKGNLIHVGQHLSMPFITESDSGEKGHYRLLDNEILEPMLEEGYIEISQEGRNKVVSVTDDGKDARRAFRYLLRDSQKEVLQSVIDSGRLS